MAPNRDCGLCLGAGSSYAGAQCGACLGDGVRCDPETRWPVIVEEKTIRVVWIEAESMPAAIHSAQHDGDMHEAFTRESVADAWWEVGDAVSQEVYACTAYAGDNAPRYGPVERCSCATYPLPVEMGKYGHRDGCARGPDAGRAAA